MDKTANGYTVELAAPGVKKEYCRVHVDEDHNLCVAIENKFEHKEEDKHAHYLRREFAYTNFEQKYTLPDNVDEAAISAKVEDGILTIELPKITAVTALLTCLAIALGLQSCNVTRTITTRSEAWQKGDTSVVIQTKTIETYDALRKL